MFANVRPSIIVFPVLMLPYYYNFSGWQGIGGDAPRVVQNPGVNNPFIPPTITRCPKDRLGLILLARTPTEYQVAATVIKVAGKDANIVTRAQKASAG